MEKKSGHAKKKKKASRAKDSEKASQGLQDKKQTEKKKSAGEILNLVLDLAKTALKTVPKGFRVRLCKLDITVCADDAADVAIGYGRYYAIIEGVLALLENYKGVFYGFRAKRKNISLRTDYHGKKTTIDFELSISFFVWQLLYIGIRLGVRYIIYVLKNAEQNQTVQQSQTGNL